MRRLVLLDGHAVLFRAFHAMPGFTAPDGSPSGAVYGFANVLIRILRELEPAYMMACFDAPGRTFRDEMYADYKGTRAETPPDLILQEPKVKALLDAFGVPHTAVSGFEADDLLATVADQALAGGRVDEVVIATGDRDLLQLADHTIKIYLLRSGVKDIELLDGAGVAKLLGLPPEDILDWKALRGDPSDNIIGVPGVGDKTALQLIKDFGSLDELYRQLAAGTQTSVRPRIAAALVECKERVYQNKELLKLRHDAPVDFDPVASARAGYQPELARSFLRGMGFHSILDRLPGAPTQKSLF